MKNHYLIIAAIVGAGIYFLFFRSKNDDVKKFDTVTGMTSTNNDAPHPIALSAINAQIAAVPSTYSELSQTFTVNV